MRIFTIFPYFIVFYIILIADNNINLNKNQDQLYFTKIKDHQLDAGHLLESFNYQSMFYADGPVVSGFSRVEEPQYSPWKIYYHIFKILKSNFLYF